MDLHLLEEKEMTKDEALDLALEALENNRRTHYYCEDTWYSCPKHEDGCANEAEGDECNCGADKANQEIDNAITAIKQARALDKMAENARELGLDYEPVQEPVDKYSDIVSDGGLDPRNTTPPQRTWVGLTLEDMETTHWSPDFRAGAKWAAAKLKEKNT